MSGEVPGTITERRSAGDAGRRRALAVAVALSLGPWGAVAALQDPGASADSGSAIIRTSGEGEVRLAPDRASISLALHARAPTAVEALGLVGDRQAAVLGVLEAERGIPRDSVETSGLRAWPVWSDGPEPEARAYQVNASMRFTARELDGLGELLAEALEAGASGIAGVSFESGREEEARTEALGLAVEAARRDAEVLAAAAGGRLGALLELVAQGPPGIQRGELAAFEMAQGGARSTVDLTPRPVIVRAHVSGAWRLDAP